MAFCPQCSKQLDDDDRFCRACGAEIRAIDPVEAESADAIKDDAKSSAPASKNASDAPTIPNFFEAIAICFYKYFNWKGRASRSEFWYWILFEILTCFVVFATVLGIMIAKKGVDDLNEANFGIVFDPVPRAMITAHALLLLPTLMVTIRRLHDIGAPGWLALAYCSLCYLFSQSFLHMPRSVFTALRIAAIVALCVRSAPGANKYGARPRRKPDA